MSPWVTFRALCRAAVRLRVMAMRARPCQSWTVSRRSREGGHNIMAIPAVRFGSHAVLSLAIAPRCSGWPAAAALRPARRLEERPHDEQARAELVRLRPRGTRPSSTSTPRPRRATASSWKLSFSGPQEGGMGSATQRATVGDGAWIPAARRADVRILRQPCPPPGRGVHRGRRDVACSARQRARGDSKDSRSSSSAAPTGTRCPRSSSCVWAWRDNPNGTFVDWNPRVSCGLP